MSTDTIDELRYRASVLTTLSATVAPVTVSSNIDLGLRALGELHADPDALFSAQSAYAESSRQHWDAAQELRVGVVTPLAEQWIGEAGDAATTDVERVAADLENTSRVHMEASVVFAALAEQHGYSLTDHAEGRQRLVDLRNAAAGAPEAAALNATTTEQVLAWFVAPLRSALTEAADVLTKVADHEEAAAGHFADGMATLIGVASTGINPLDITPLSDRRSIDDILANYHVSADPGGIVVFPDESTIVGRLLLQALQLEDPEFEPLALTASEAEIYADLGPRAAAAFLAEREAGNRTGELFGDPGQHNGHGDAFRHAYWNALLTAEYGADWTNSATTAHERRADNNPIEQSMDLHNNEVGRRIAQENPDVGRDELSMLIHEAVLNGEMIVIGADGQPTYSDQAEVGTTGRPPVLPPRTDGEPPPPAAEPDGGYLSGIPG